ncbi:hypothetical protein SEA_PAULODIABOLI_369 [Microbacterium phage PauloDiaboli]|nr:hypothetical protein SEA_PAULODIABOLI_14 [Microbacterium phage PauloDiaboli]QIG58088.1 hypothetical protein SEA_PAULODIABOLI_369 [Microbacterium phage PauloDiaboli]
MSSSWRIATTTDARTFASCPETTGIPLPVPLAPHLVFPSQVAGPFSCRFSVVTLALTVLCRCRNNTVNLTCRADRV